MDFEGTNPKGRFDDLDGNPDHENQLVADPGPANDPANKVLRLRVLAGRGGGSDVLKVLPAGYDALFARWYFKYEPGFNFAARNHGGGLAAGDQRFVGRSGIRPMGDDFAGFYVQYQPTTAKLYAYSYYRGMYQDCANPQGRCWGDSLPCLYDSGQAYCSRPHHRPQVPVPALQAGTWYCVEQMLSMGMATPTGRAANGHLSLWLDSTLVADFRGLWIRTTPDLKIRMLWLSLYHHDGTHSAAGALIDNVVVSSERIGCSGRQRARLPGTGAD